MKQLMCILLFCVAAASPARSDEPEVLAVRLEKVGMLWNIHVTLKHPDTGWDHYADAWEVLDAAGDRLALRRLAHPHVEEQPFTRALSGVVLPDGTRVIQVRGRCSVQGWATKAVRVSLSP